MLQGVLNLVMTIIDQPTDHFNHLQQWKNTCCLSPKDLFGEDGQ